MNKIKFYISSVGFFLLFVFSHQKKSITLSFSFVVGLNTLLCLKIFQGVRKKVPGIGMVTEFCTEWWAQYIEIIHYL